MGLQGSRSSESSPIELVLGALRKGANQLALELGLQERKELAKVLTPASQSQEQKGGLEAERQ